MSQNEEFNDKLSPDENIFINPADGLPNQHPTLPSDIDSEEETINVDSDTFDDLPTSIIVTNIHSEVFQNDKLKTEMENLFRLFSNNCTFQWLRSFRRLRVNYDNAISAANARLQLHQYEFNKKSVIHCYFAQPVTPVSNKNLQPPAPVKQFLISPPASPPAGWEPREENEPLVNHDLLAALANLTPGESHELHPQTDDQPGIIVHTAKIPDNTNTKNNNNNNMSVIDDDDNDDNNDDDNNDDNDTKSPKKQQIIHTKCPERTT